MNKLPGTDQFVLDNRVFPHWVPDWELDWVQHWYYPAVVFGEAGIVVAVERAVVVVAAWIVREVTEVRIVIP